MPPCLLHFWLIALMHQSQVQSLLADLSYPPWPPRHICSAEPPTLTE